MATAIQIFVAGALLVAWIWVLGRPLLSGSDKRRAYDDLDRPIHERPGFDSLPDGEADEFGPFGGEFGWAGRAAVAATGPPRRWWHQPVEVRRRQMMLATLLATFLAFFLAVAFKGLFIGLFGLMTIGLVVHLVVASWIGSRIEADRRAVVVSHAKRRVPARAGGMAIHAPRATELPEAPLTADPVEPSSVVSDLIDQAWGRDDEPADSLRAPSVRAPRVDAASDDGAPVTPSARADRSVSSDVAPEPRPPADGLLVEGPLGDQPPADEHADADADRASVAEPGPAEPIFTRAAKDRRARSRRKAQPIYIESQLDEAEEPPARAVNDR